MKAGHVLLVAGVCAGFAARASDEASRQFVEKVKPLLESRCVSCHGPDKVKSGLRLDSREAVQDNSADGFNEQDRARRVDGRPDGDNGQRVAESKRDYLRGLSIDMTASNIPSGSKPDRLCLRPA